MSSAPSIVCKDCNHVNEFQRVYCHNCGTKLDRSAVVERQRKGAEETAEQKQKRVRKLMNPGSGLLGWSTVSTLFRTLFWGAIAAVAINVLRPPAEVPPMPEHELVDALPMGTLLQEVTTASAGRSVTFREDDINEYFQKVLRAKGDKEAPIRFQRAFVKLDDGTIRITSQSVLYKHPVYTGVTFSAAGVNGHFRATPKEIHLGCMTVPQFISQHFGFAVDFLFQSLWKSLNRETKDIENAGQVIFRKGEVLVSSPGTPLPAAPATPAPAAAAAPAASTSVPAAPADSPAPAAPVAP